MPDIGERIWGRGSADDKNGLVAIMFVLKCAFNNAGCYTIHLKVGD